MRVKAVTGNPTDAASITTWYPAITPRDSRRPIRSLTAGADIPALHRPTWLLWGVAVGVCSSVVPYVADQLAMARLPRATFALMLALLPVCATIIGAVVLGQIPTVADLGGIALVVAGLVLHQPDRAT